MAAQGKFRTEMAQVIGVAASSASRKCAGESQFTLDEIEKVAVWLGVPIMRLVDPAEELSFSQ